MIYTPVSLGLGRSMITRSCLLCQRVLIVHQIQVLVTVQSLIARAADAPFGALSLT